MKKKYCIEPFSSFLGLILYLFMALAPGFKVCISDKNEKMAQFFKMVAGLKTFHGNWKVTVARHKHDQSILQKMFRPKLGLPFLDVVSATALWTEIR